jgi:hypothetical protein
MQSLFKPRTIQIKTSLPIDILLERLKKEAIVDGNAFQINSRFFDIFYRSSYVVGKIEKSGSLNTVSAEIRPTSHVKAGTFLMLTVICLGLIPLTLQIIAGSIALKVFFLGISGIAVLAAIVCIIVRGMFTFSASFKEQSIRQLIEGPHL